jgi:hypothetical protein
MLKGASIYDPEQAVLLILGGHQLFKGDKLHTNKWLQEQTIRDIKWWVFQGQLCTAEKEVKDGVDQ